MIKNIVALVALAMLAGCVTAATQFEQDFSVGQMVSGKIVAPQGDILLPPGDWTIVGTSISHNNHYQSFGHTALARIEDDGNLNGLVFVMTALETPLGFSFYSSSQCTPDDRDIYFEEIADQHMGKQLCFFVDNWSMWPDSEQEGVYLQAHNYFISHGIERPDSMLFSVHRVVRRNKLMIAEYGFDFREPVPVAIPDYTPKDTSVTKELFNNPRWQKNLDNVIAWSRENHQKIASEFLD